MESEKVFTGNLRHLRWIVSAIVLILIVSALTQPHPGFDLLTIGPIVMFAVAVGIFVYVNHRRLQQAIPNRKLVLDPNGLKYEIGSGNYSITWNQCDHYIVRKTINGDVHSLVIISRDGKWIPIMSFNDMQGILAIISTKMGVPGPQSSIEAPIYNRWLFPVLYVISLTGSVVILNSWPQWMTADQRLVLGVGLLAPAAIVYTFMSSKNPLIPVMKAYRKQTGGGVAGFAKSFLLNFLLWTIIVVILLIVFTYTGKK